MRALDTGERRDAGRCGQHLPDRPETDPGRKEMSPVIGGSGEVQRLGIIIALGSLLTIQSSGDIQSESVANSC